VLRRVAQNREASLIPSTVLDTPSWLLARWTKTYGRDTARAIAEANGHEPALDLTVKHDAADWAERLHGRALPTGTVRTLAHGAISLLPGFTEGAWWVQDAAAALPARLFGDLSGKHVADLCAAPGGKTAQLAFAGARVTAVDRSAARLARLNDNLSRLSLKAEVVVVDALEWQNGPFDAVLLDAPCSSTGTIRRHPDVPWLKGEADFAVLASLQQRLLDRAVELLKPGGTLVYCVCSLEPEEAEQQIAALIARDPRVKRQSISAADVFGCAECVSAEGDLRTLPMQLPDLDPRWGGLDGFYAARLVRN
jgi:16S rRNA (cytosine967-C5)-methyltransferase